MMTQTQIGALHVRREQTANSKRTVATPVDRSACARLWLVGACGVMLAVGFVLAARNHVAAVGYGYQREALLREQTQLLDEQKRLQLALSEASAPVRLEQAARDIGLVPARSAQFKSK